MAASRSESEEIDDPYDELYVDAEDDNDGEQGSEEDSESEEIDDDDMNDDQFEDEDEFEDAEEDHEVSFIVELEEDTDAGEGASHHSGNQEHGAAEPAEERDTSPDPFTLLRLFAGNGGGQGIPRYRLLSLIRRGVLDRRILDGDDEDADGRWFGRRRGRPDPNRFPKVPSEKGRELMHSGTFGANDLSSFSAQKRIARRILDRELGIEIASSWEINREMMAQSLLPTTDAEAIINYDEPVYSGQFSDDGNFFYACVKDFKVRMYDTSNPYNWRHYKTVEFPFGSWTLTDASLSPDNKWLAYSSITSNVMLAPTDPNDTGDPYPLNLADAGSRRPGWRSAFGIWSIRFSGDGRELVAGTSSNSIVVYDIESRRVLHAIEGHDNHVNAVCFADKSSPHILYSGSDDATIKVWDRRSMGDGREAGAFVGHIEGLTYIDSKGDGRYILSNAKDQTMKLWDLKMMMTTTQFAELDPTQHTRYSDFDYRWEVYDEDNWFPHPNDNSLVTFRGHKVLRTLIRCHFSPPGSTDSRYVYTGSHDGKVYIYNMDATIAGTIDVKATTAHARSVPEQWRRFMRGRRLEGWDTCVRDAAWHPNAPFIAASALNGWNQELGTVSVHSFNEMGSDEGTPKMGTGYSENLIPVKPPGDDDDSSDEDEDMDDLNLRPRGLRWMRRVRAR